MSDEPRPPRRHKPYDRLSRLAAAMTDLLEADPEYQGETAVVMLSSAADGQCMTHLAGYEDETEAVVDMFIHLRAIVRATGRDLQFIGIPDDVSGIDER